MQDVMSKAKESTFKTATCKGHFLFPFHRRLTVGPGGRPAKQAAAWRSLLGLSEQRCRKRRKRRVGCRPQGSNQAALRGLEEMTEQTWAGPHQGPWSWKKPEEAKEKRPRRDAQLEAIKAVEGSFGSFTLVPEDHHGNQNFLRWHQLYTPGPQ